MSTDRNRLEFERIRNLVQGFGLSVVKEEIQDDKLIMSLERKRVVPIIGTEGVSAG